MRIPFSSNLSKWTRAFGFNSAPKIKPGSIEPFRAPPGANAKEVAQKFERSLGNTHETQHRRLQSETKPDSKYLKRETPDPRYLAEAMRHRQNAQEQEIARRAPPPAPPPAKGLTLDQAFAELGLSREGNFWPRQPAKGPPPVTKDITHVAQRSGTQPHQPAIQGGGKPLPAIPVNGGGPGRLSPDLSDAPLDHQQAYAKARFGVAEKAYRDAPHSLEKKQAFDDAKRELESVASRSRSNSASTQRSEAPASPLTPSPLPPTPPPMRTMPPTLQQLLENKALPNLKAAEAAYRADSTTGNARALKTAKEEVSRIKQVILAPAASKAKENLAVAEKALHANYSEANLSAFQAAEKEILDISRKMHSLYD